MGESGERYIYEVNQYYGIYTDVENDGLIKEIIEENEYYKDLVDGEISQDNFTIISSYNSDKEATLYFLFVDEMTEASEYFHSEVPYGSLTPTMLVNMEKKFKKAVMYIDELAEYIMDEIEKRGRDKRIIKYGWFVANCCWEDDSTSDTSANEDD